MQSFGSVLGEKKCCQGFLINYLSKISIFSCFTHETFLCEMASSKNKLYIYSTYRTRAIITRGLYIFYQLFEGQKHFLRDFFRKILALCMVSIQERFLINLDRKLNSRLLATLRYFVS